jgi:hypothetical protein
MQKRKLSSPTVSPRRVLVVGLAAMLFASCASTVPATKSAQATITDRMTPGQEEKKPAQPASDTETVETRLVELFDICKNDDAEMAAVYFVYRGPDKSREWKDTFRASEPVEKAEVKDICLRIKGYLDESQGYLLGAVKVERESEGEWHALEVSFQQGGEAKKVIFAFLQIKGQFAIGDIDE